MDIRNLYTRAVIDAASADGSYAGFTDTCCFQPSEMTGAQIREVHSVD